MAKKISNTTAKKKSSRKKTSKATPVSRLKSRQPDREKSNGMPKAGSIAPDFTLFDIHGHAVTLSKLKGTRVVIYFYPKDDTPGCTIEAQEFSKEYTRFLKQGIVVFGISKDTAKDHCAFVAKYSLTIPLLADPTRETIKKYGCQIEKNMYGKKVMGTQRATFVIDKKGLIEKVYPNVTPEGHAREILNDL